jgi:hypothetical protein
MSKNQRHSSIFFSSWSSFMSRNVCFVLLVCTLFLGSSIGVRAAGGLYGNLNGTVVDASSGAPIAAARVDVASPSGTFHAQTDAHGYFAFLQIPTDTYVLSVQKQGYQSSSLPGVLVFGDETQSAGTIRLAQSLKTIAVVHSRGASSAYQPTQTIDATEFVGQRVNQALGENGSTNFNQLVQAAPGVTLTAPGSLNPISIRGSMSSEVGYQFDGINISGLVFDENQTGGYLNGIGGGRGSLQVVSGAGDATQGGISGGVINVVPGRGSYPGTGFVSFDVSSPWYDHSMAFQYGIATPNGRYSDFISTRSDRAAPQIAPYGRSAADAGQFLGESFSYDDDVLNNFFYSFGKNNNQQIQVLTDFADHRAWNHLGGPVNFLGPGTSPFQCGVDQNGNHTCNGYGNYYPWDPYDYGSYFQSDYNGNPMWPSAGAISGQQWFDQIIPWEPGVPFINNGTTPQPVYGPEQYLYGPTDLLKIGYKQQLGSDANLNVFFYNSGGQNERNIWNDSQGLTDSSNIPGYGPEGGHRVGWNAQIVKAFGEHHTVTLLGQIENANPVIGQMSVANMFQGFYAQRGLTAQSLGGTCTPNTGQQSFLPSTYTYCTNEPNIEDWFLPQTLGQPVSATNPCIGPAADNNYNTAGATNMGCYIYSWLLANGKWNGIASMPRIPDAGWNLRNTDFQTVSVALRDQWNPTSKLNVDWGLRLDSENMKWAANPYSADLSNPSDVGLSHSAMPQDYLHPRSIEPRAAFSYELDPNDAVRASYGRSLTFLFAQYAGTPAALQFVNPLLNQIPAKDVASGLGSGCGSGWHGPGSNGNGTYTQNPYSYFSGPTLTPNGQGWYFPCQNYASSLFWEFDQAYSAPDMGGTFPPTYSNYDLAYSHQFHNGWGTKLTGYWRRGFNTFQAQLLNLGQPNPITGQFSNGTFEDAETGQTKTFGLEFMLTTPDRPYGLSGFLTANYINSLTTTPPVAGSDSLPSGLPQYFLEQGQYYHAAFVAPFSIQSGIDYTTRFGLRINPVVSFDNGYPYGVGTDAFGFINGRLYHMPEGNVGVATPYAGPGGPNQSFDALCYVDPAFAGSYLHPKDFACRGYAAPTLAGNSYTRPRLYSDVDLEYTPPRSRYTLGVYIANIFNNYRSEPVLNQDWQPVATGVGGAQSGQYSSTYPILAGGAPNPTYLLGGRDGSIYDQSWLPFQEMYQPGRTYRFYLQIKL